MNYITGFRTKSFEITDEDERKFSGVSTVEMVDLDGEITSRDMMLGQFKKWMKRGAPIIDRHSNRVVGKGLSYEPVEVVDDRTQKTFYGVKMDAKIFNDHKLDDHVWSNIKSGAYRGLSYGGANLKDREPIKQSDGTLAYKLNDIELYEVSVCPEPSAPLALITNFNQLAKSLTADDLSEMDVSDCEEPGTVRVKCDKLRCYVSDSEEFRDSLTLGAVIYPHTVSKGKMATVRKGDEDKKDDEIVEEKVEDKKDKADLTALTASIAKFVDHTTKVHDNITKEITDLKT